MVARDVEGAIRAHDYIEAMRVLRSALATRADVNALNFASVRLLLRPSVGLAAAISEDEGALRILDSLAAAVPEDHPGRRASIDCQWPFGTARGRPAELPAGGHENCPFMANRSAHRGAVASAMVGLVG